MNECYVICRRTYNTLGEGFVLQCGKTEIPDLDRASGTRDENVVAFQVSVYDRWDSRV